MEPSTRFTYPAQDGVDIVGYRWDPAGMPRGAVQLTHGMGEHVRRYGSSRAPSPTAAWWFTARTTGATAPPRDPKRSSASWGRTAGPSWSTTSTCSCP